MKTLIVEDDDQAVRDIGRWLAENGFSVEIANDGISRVGLARSSATTRTNDARFDISPSHQNRFVVVTDTTEISNRVSVWLHFWLGEWQVSLLTLGDPHQQVIRRGPGHYHPHR